MIVTTARPLAHRVPPFLRYKNFKQIPVSQEVGKVMMARLADVGLGHFVDSFCGVSQTGMAHLEHQEYFGAFCVFLPQSH